MSEEPEHTFMIPGKMYKLRGLQKNKAERYMGLSCGYSTSDHSLLVRCRKGGWPNSVRYTDGDVFVCVSIDTTKQYSWTPVRYRVLTPGGAMATVVESGNKSKFTEVRS
jgi:hypothetical protein